MSEIKSKLISSKEKIIDKMNNKKSPKVIANSLSDIHGLTFTADDIIDFIKDEFNKEWDTDKRKYDIIKNIENTMERPTQESFLDDDTPKHSSDADPVEENTPEIAEGNDETGSNPNEPIPKDEQNHKPDNQPSSEDKSPTNDTSVPIKDKEIIEGDYSEPHKIKQPASDHDEDPPIGVYKEENGEAPSKKGSIKHKSSQLDDPPPGHPPNTNCIEKLNEAINYLSVIHKTVLQLEADNRALSNRLASIEKLLIEDNPIHKSHNLADDMIKIYASENSKKNVNINPVINDRIIEFMKSRFNIRNNNAQAINTALLIALYKSKIDEK